MLTPLVPIDVVHQFDGLTDEQAAQVADLAVRTIADGRLSPDRDYRSAWLQVLPLTIQHLRHGAHPPDAGGSWAKATPDQIIADMQRIVQQVPNRNLDGPPAARNIDSPPASRNLDGPPAARNLEGTVVPPPVDRTAVDTLHGTPVEQLRDEQAAQPVGMHRDYIVLSDAERAKGFTRPVRTAYRHVGRPAPQHPCRPLTAEELEHYPLADYRYVQFEEYPASEAPKTGRFWTQAEIDSIGKGCGTVTTMGTRLAETYARDPSFYGATFCAGCNKHLPVGATGEFVWAGTTERVGT